MKRILLITIAALTMNANAEVSLLSSATTTAAFTVLAGLKAKKFIDCWGKTGSGSGSATVLIQGSSGGKYFTTLATCSLTLATTVTDNTNTCAATLDAPPPYLKVKVSAISGSSAEVSCDMGAEQ